MTTTSPFTAVESLDPIFHHSLGKLRVLQVNCRIREHVEVARCFNSQGYGHVSRGCALSGSKDVCWRCRSASHVAKECKAPPRCLTCADRGEEDVAHASGSGSCPVFRAELRRLRVESEISTAQPRKRECSRGATDAVCRGEEGRCVAH